MLFAPTPGGEQLFKDRVFVRKLLLTGRSTGCVSKLVDCTMLVTSTAPRERSGQPAAKKGRGRRVHPRKGD
eukprot:3403237-Lingulodinium_polyedra.AAC.1